jgi:chlorobactene glucosyltransferase
VLHVLLGICAVYSAICLAMLVANLALMPRLSRAEPVRGQAPLLSIVVPARNEERAIEAAVRSLLAQDYPSFEVIVVEDRSTDRTADILRGLATDLRLRVVSGVEPPEGWLGKPHALFQGSRAARGELLLFVDADVRYRSDTVSRAVGDLTAQRADSLVLFPRFEVGSFWEEVLMPNLICSVFFGPAFLINFRWPRWLAAGGGAGNLVRRSAYEAVGGHETLRASVVDDVRLGYTLKQAGFRLRVTLANEHVEVRMYSGFREVWDGFTKNVAYACSGWAAVIFLSLSLLWTVVAILPPAVLVAAAAGARIVPIDVARAAISLSLLIGARVILAAALGDKIWPPVTHPLMAAVWAGLLARSLFHRLVRRKLLWRGRAFDARKAGF